MSKVILSLDNWTYAEFNEFLKRLNKGEFEGTYNLARRIIVSWDYDVPLDSDDPMEELNLEDAIAVLKAIQTTLADFVETVEIKDYKVNLKAWKNRDFFAFNEASREGKFAKVEQMLRQIVTVPGATDAPLTAPQGIRANKALSSAYEKAMNGKN